MLPSDDDSANDPRTVDGCIPVVLRLRDDQAEASHKIGAEKGAAADGLSSSRQVPLPAGRCALDLGGSLIKLVYFCPGHSATGSAAGPPSSTGDDASCSTSSTVAGGGSLTDGAAATGGLCCVKFASHDVGSCIEFIEANGLHRAVGSNGQTPVRVVATGGGAHKYADVFQERLGLALQKADEVAALVAGCTFLRRAVPQEAFTFQSGVRQYVDGDGNLYPYLLVIVGSGVSVIKVLGDGAFERVSGSHMGGGTFGGLCRLLTGRRGFDEVMALSASGDAAKVDMTVGDIYGGQDYSAIGLQAEALASSFGKGISLDRDAADYEPADVAAALCRMVAYNVGQLAHFVAKEHGLPHVFFGGSFIGRQAHVMEAISGAVRFWSQGKTTAVFLQHEGYLGAVGAFLELHPQTPTAQPAGDCTEALNLKDKLSEPESTCEEPAP